jgi:C4-dicarboxylate transporter, DctM subunit
MLVYAISVTGSAAIEVGDLFLAGIGPAFLIAGMLAIYSRFRGAPSSVAMRPRSSFQDVRRAVREGIWALLLPVIVLGGIGFGVFKNVTEAAAVSIVYAVTVELFIHRELRWKDLPPAILKSMSMMGALLLIIAISFALNAFMVEKGAAENFLEWIREQNMSPAGFLLAINVFLIVTGALMDSISAIVLFTPLIAPAAVALGIDPLHLGIVFIVNMEIGYVAPPIATNLFVSAQLFGKPFGQVVRSTLPTLGILCVGLVLVTYVPTVSIGAVYALKGGSFVQPFGGYSKGKKPGHVPPGSVAGQPPGQASDAGTGSAAPMTMEEMMRRAKEKREREEQGLPPDAEASPEPGQPLTIQEMMQRAKVKREAEEAAAPSADSGM